MPSGVSELTDISVENNGGGISDGNSPSHKSHNAFDNYPKMHHFVTEMYDRAHFCYKNVHSCARFCHKMVHCGIWDWYIVEFVQ